jgi:ribosomal protein S10
MTPRQFENKVVGYSRKQEAESRERWEITRYNAFISIKPHLKKGAKLLETLSLPWDKKEIIAIIPIKSSDFWDKVDELKEE